MLRKTSIDPDLVWDGLIWALIFGLIGARLYHVFTPSQSLLDQGIDTKYYFQHPLTILTIWQGGLGIPGAIAGGVFGLYLFARRRGLDIYFLLDIATPGVALAQAIGRWGNFINQELYGPPTDLPWKIFIQPVNRISGYESFEFIRLDYVPMWGINFNQIAMLAVAFLSGAALFLRHRVKRTSP
jgi:phosphatidylglycerol:prolipoprotein diacylglycerol transferase